MSDKSTKVEKLVEEIEKLSVLEVSELVNTLQEKLGVTATAPIATAAAPALNVATETSAGEASSGGGGGTVIMTASGDNKIAVIKALREINQNIGLKEAKDMTENLPAEVLKDAKPEEAKAASERLKAAGATAEVK